MDYLDSIRANEAQEGFKVAGSHWKASMLLQPEKGRKMRAFSETKHSCPLNEGV